jgi:hypothetical protein
MRAVMRSTGPISFDARTAPAALLPVTPGTTGMATSEVTGTTTESTP